MCACRGAGPVHRTCFIFLSACDYEGSSLARWDCWASAGQLIPRSEPGHTSVHGGLDLWGEAEERLTRNRQVWWLDRLEVTSSNQPV